MSFDLELFGEAPVPDVTLVSPADGSATNDPSVAFAASASDPTGLASATLYIGSAPRIVTSSGPTAIEDAQITADDPNTNAGGDLSINVDGQNPHAHAVIKFPTLIGSEPGQVPPGAAVASATLEVKCTNTSATPLRVHRLLEDWTEGEVTWNDRMAEVPWSNAGADGASCDPTPYSGYENEPWYGGHYPADKNDDSFQLFPAGGMDFIAIHLQFWPSAAEIAWANDVLAAHRERKAIITTHGYLDASGNRNVHVMGSTQYIWEDLVASNPNVFFVLCGHEDGECARTDTVGSRKVHQLLADYQDLPNGGNGYLRILRFVPAEDRVYVFTYSPWLDAFPTDADSEFALDFPMQGFRAIGTASGIPSGGTASIEWTAAAEGTAYEWYAVATDPTGRSASSEVFTFTTSSSNRPPVAAHDAYATLEDAALEVAAPGVLANDGDPDGQPIAAVLVAGPSHGTLTLNAIAAKIIPDKHRRLQRS